MLRCCQLIFHSRKSNTRIISNLWSSYAKPRYASNPPKPRSLDRPRKPIGLPSDEACSALVDGPVDASTSHVNNGTVYSYGPDNPGHCKLAGTPAARSRLFVQSHDESPTHPSQDNTEFTTLDTSCNALSPPFDPAASLGSTSLNVFADALEFVNGVLGNITSDTILPTHFEQLRTILWRFGPDLLRQLDAKASDELLCLLGTISDEINACKFHNHLGQWCTNLTGRKFWEEIMMVAEMKESLGHLFGERENYWSMRAYLEQTRTKCFEAARQKAQAYYLRLALTIRSEPAIVVPYLNSFFMPPLMPEFGGALNILLGVLNQHNPHRDIVGILWTVILTYNNVLSLEQKEAILDMMHLRLSSSKPGNFREHAGKSPGIEDIVVGFVASFFPCYLEMGTSPVLLSWAKDCAQSSIAGEIPINDRFSNLVLLAAWIMPQKISGLPDFRFVTDGHDWRPFIGLAMLDQVFHGRNLTFAEVRELQTIIRSLWYLWEGVTTIDTPGEIRRIVATAFLRAAARLRDRLLLDSCLEDISAGVLWKTASHVEEPEARQVEQLFRALAECVLVFGGLVSTRMLSFLGDVPHNSFHLDFYLTGILIQLATSDADTVYRFYCECLSHGIPISSEASIFVAQTLAYGHYWDQVTAFLQDDRFDSTSLEPLLETILRTFQTNRQEDTAPALAGATAEAMLTCYSNVKIPSRLKYPIRFFLPIMIASRHPLKAVQVLEVLRQNNPTMFSYRYFLRIIHTLFQYRQFTLGVRVFHIATEVFHEKPAIIKSLFRKTRYRLACAGAFKLASPPYIDQPCLETLRDHFVSLSLRKPGRSVWWTVLRSFHVLTASPINGSVVLIAVQVLLRHRRFNLARQLIAQSSSQLKSQDMTAIGNTYLHASLLYWNKRNGRLMRHVLRAKDFLSQKYSFVADRITVNIVIKTMLRWRGQMDSRNIMCLFDHLVRNGYPASERWHTANGVPFGTPPGEVALDLSGIRQGFSFKRHVRPLYKMLIQELFLRKNARAAQRIIGILKEEEVLVREVKEHRERARRLGVIKKQHALAKTRMKNEG